MSRHLSKIAAMLSKMESQIKTKPETPDLSRILVDREGKLFYYAGPSAEADSSIVVDLQTGASDYKMPNSNFTSRLVLRGDSQRKRNFPPRDIAAGLPEVTYDQLNSEARSIATQIEDAYFSSHFQAESKEEAMRRIEKKDIGERLRDKFEEKGNTVDFDEEKYKMESAQEQRINDLQKMLEESRQPKPYSFASVEIDDFCDDIKKFSNLLDEDLRTLLVQKIAEDD